MQDNKTNETYVEFLLEKHQIYELQNLISDEKLDFLIENCYNSENQYIKIKIETYGK